MRRFSAVLAAMITAAFLSHPAVLRADDPVSPPTFTPPGPATRPAGVTLDDVLKGLTLNENAIHTLHVKQFDLTRQTLAAPGAAWQPTPWRLAGSAWYESPGDRCRIHLTSQVMEWTNGSAPYADSELDLSYDGTEGRVVRIASGPFGKPLSPDRQGQ